MGGESKAIMVGLATVPILAIITTPASASADKPVIALANAYYGNMCRHQMVDAFKRRPKRPRRRAKSPTMSS